MSVTLSSSIFLSKSFIAKHTDIDECDPGCHVHSTCHDCGANSRCVNTLGSFNCDCNQFYQRIEDTMSCKGDQAVINVMTTYDKPIEMSLKLRALL